MVVSPRDRRKEMPVEAGDLVVEWTPQIVMRIRFCPFCGAKIDPTRDPARMITKL